MRDGSDLDCGGAIVMAWNRWILDIIWEFKWGHGDGLVVWGGWWRKGKNQVWLLSHWLEQYDRWCGYLYKSFSSKVHSLQVGKGKDKV